MDDHCPGFFARHVAQSHRSSQQLRAQPDRCPDPVVVSPSAASATDGWHAEVAPLGVGRGERRRKVRRIALRSCAGSLGDDVSRDQRGVVGVRGAGMIAPPLACPSMASFYTTPWDFCCDFRNHRKIKAVIQAVGLSRRSRREDLWTRTESIIGRTQLNRIIRGRPLLDSWSGRKSSSCLAREAISALGRQERA